ncbi:MAG: HAD family hydrolase [Chrysiogenales bacterium]|nr:MAG: HAD family hydrolase [Chrysiogenales bacterium]
MIRGIDFDVQLPLLIGFFSTVWGTMFSDTDTNAVVVLGTIVFIPGGIIFLIIPSPSFKWGLRCDAIPEGEPMNGIEANLDDCLIAFFDLDETITDSDTDFLWAAWRSRRSLRGWAERAWLVKLYRDFRRGRLDIDEYIRYQRFRIGRLGPEEFRGMGEDFFRESGIGRIYPDAEGVIGRIRDAGCRAVLLTAQNEMIAGPFARSLGMDGMIANRFGIVGGRFGAPVRPYSFGEGKVLLGQKYAEDAGVPLSRCAFFGDSIYDAPFLGLVGRPFAVNPDHMLEARAVERGWPVLRFVPRSARR